MVQAAGRRIEETHGQFTAAMNWLRCTSPERCARCDATRRRARGASAKGDIRESRGCPSLLPPGGASDRAQSFQIGNCCARRSLKSVSGSLNPSARTLRSAASTWRRSTAPKAAPKSSS